jgi:2-aminoethylphosphonate-pyruvate transaminase
MKRILLNPGPVTVTDDVIHACHEQNCHREDDVKRAVEAIKSNLVKLVTIDVDEFRVVLFASSGTGALEATLLSTIKRNSFPLVISNGAYGRRISEILEKADVAAYTLEYKWGTPIDFDQIDGLLKEGLFKTVIMVHHETTTGLLNPIKGVGSLARKYGCTYIVDAISSIGGVPLDIKECFIDYLVGVGNKCIQGLPGLSFVICRKEHIEKLNEISPSLYLDLVSEYHYQEREKSLRFTAPVQIIYALEQALQELRYEGVVQRNRRYSENYDTLVEGYQKLGFELFENKPASKLIATFYYPKKFDFDAFHDKMYARKYVIYPGMLTQDKTFRIAVMGDINSNDIDCFISASKQVLSYE